MNHAEDKILACVDLSGYAEHVADCAAWAAKRLQAPLEFLHVIERHPALDGTQDHSGTLGANANETLLNNLSEEDAARTRAEREYAREFLNTLRVRAEEAGAHSVDTRQRHGDLEETLSEQQHGASLFVLGRRGASAQNEKRALGLHVEWTVRSLQRPILAVTEQFKTPERVLIAFDGSAVTRKGIEMVAVSPLFKGLPVHVVMAGQTGRDQRKPLAWACQTLEQAGFDVAADSLPGNPADVINQIINQKGIDLLVMGAYSHSPLRNLFKRSKTTELLRRALVPTLLLR